jgi:hypothetical protein
MRACDETADRVMGSGMLARSCMASCAGTVVGVGVQGAGLGRREAEVHVVV